MNINFNESKLADAIEVVQKFYPSDEFAVFHGTELIFEKSDMLDEDEVEAYTRNVKRGCREIGPYGQILLMVEPEGGQAIKAYFMDSPQLREPCLEQHIGERSMLTKLEEFMINSNKKPAIAKAMARPQVTAPLPDTADCDDISDSEDVVEEHKKQSASKMDVELDKPDIEEVEVTNDKGVAL